MNMLVVPIMLGSMALIYGTYDANRQLEIENQREQIQKEIENRREEVQQTIENRRVEAQQDIEDNRINEDILQSYFDDISNLILVHGLNAENLEGKEIDEFNEAQILARARTLSTVSVLDGKRNGLLLRFLIETNLLDLLQGERLAIDLQETVLPRCELSGISLNESNLSKAVLVDTNFSKAYLLGVNFQGALLQKANFQGAALFRANFSEANITDTKFKGALYDSTTIWPEGFDPVAAGAIKTTVAEWSGTTH